MGPAEAWRSGAAIALPLVLFAVGTAQVRAQDDAQVRSETVTTFADPELTESSGLVVVGEQWATINDSGDAGRVFLVDPATGRTQRTVEFDPDARDVEAIAPAFEDATSVWVGDIGDNLKVRERVTLHHVPLDGSPGGTVRLRHPGGAVDAEALMTHPVTGELVVVTKEILGGSFEVVPRAAVRSALSGDSQERTRTLRAVGRAPSLVTDGAFFADGHHVVVRNYGFGYLYSWPQLERLGQFALPQQAQGESLAVDTDGSLLIGSEGLHAPVLRVQIPADLVARMAPEAREPAPSAVTSPPAAEPKADTKAADTKAAEREDSPQTVSNLRPGPWLVGASLLLLLAIGSVTWRRLRR